MTIDWFTFVAQVLNFLLLVWLLKRFLYAPVLTAMDQRESRIISRLDDAATAQSDADRIKTEYQSRLAELDQEQKQILTAAQHEANSWRVEQLRVVREEVATQRNKWRTTLFAEKHNLMHQVRQEIIHHTVELSRRVLLDLADESLQRQSVRRFIQLLENTEGAGADLVNAMDGQGFVTVKTAHALPTAAHQEMSAALQRLISPDIDVRFQVASLPDCGIEIQVAGYKLEWNIRKLLFEYESELKSQLTSTFDSQAVPDDISDLFTPTAVLETPEAKGGAS